MFLKKIIAMAVILCTSICIFAAQNSDHNTFIEFKQPLIDENGLIDEDPIIEHRVSRCTKICNFLSTLKYKLKNPILIFLQSNPKILNAISMIVPAAVESTVGYAATQNNQIMILNTWSGTAAGITSIPLINLCFAIINFKSINCTHLHNIKFMEKIFSAGLLTIISTTFEGMIFSIFIPDEVSGFGKPLFISLFSITTVIPAIFFIYTGPRQSCWKHLKRIVLFPINFLVIKPSSELKKFLLESIENNNFINNQIDSKNYEKHLPLILKYLEEAAHLPNGLNKLICAYISSKLYDLNDLNNCVKHIDNSEDNRYEDKLKIVNLMFDYVDKYADFRNLSFEESIEKADAGYLEYLL